MNRLRQLGLAWQGRRVGLKLLRNESALDLSFPVPGGAGVDANGRSGAREFLSIQSETTARQSCTFPTIVGAHTASDVVSIFTQRRSNSMAPLPLLGRSSRIFFKKGLGRRGKGPEKAYGKPVTKSNSDALDLEAPSLRDIPWVRLP